MNIKLKIALINIFVLALFAVDRLLKVFFYQISPEREIFVFGHWVKLNLATNSGVAFGLPLNFYVLIVLYAVILVALVWFLMWFYRQRKVSLILFVCLVIAGAFSNLLDRFYFGGVIDYIDVKYYSVFNLADIMIVVGIIGLALKSFKTKK